MWYAAAGGEKCTRTIIGFEKAIFYSVSVSGGCVQNTTFHCCRFWGYRKGWKIDKFIQLSFTPFPGASLNSQHWSWHTINYEFMAFVCRTFFGVVQEEHFHISPLHPLSLQNEAVDVDIDEILDMDTDDIRRSHLFVSRNEKVSRLFDVSCLTKEALEAFSDDRQLTWTHLIDDYTKCLLCHPQSLLTTSTCKRSEKDISVSRIQSDSKVKLIFLSCFSQQKFITDLLDRAKTLWANVEIDV